jgi:hypothetical protein
MHASSFQVHSGVRHPLIVQEQFYQVDSRLRKANALQGHHHVDDRISVGKNELMDKSACNELAAGGETDVHPKGDGSETLRQAAEDHKGRVDVRLPARRANGIKDPHQVRLPGGKAEVPVAKVQRFCHRQNDSGTHLPPLLHQIVSDEFVRPVVNEPPEVRRNGMASRPEPDTSGS